MTYHVVCHDCTFEELARDSWVAEQLKESHMNHRGHNIEYMKVD